MTIKQKSVSFDLLLEKISFSATIRKHFIFCSRISLTFYFVFAKQRLIIIALVTILENK